MTPPRPMTSAPLGVASRWVALPRHRDLEIAGRTGPGHEGTYLCAQLQAELDLDLLRCFGQGSQLVEEPLDRRLNTTHRLLEGLLSLLDNPLLAVCPPTGHLAARGRGVDLYQYRPAVSQRELHEPLAHVTPRSPSRSQRRTLLTVARRGRPFLM